jgi:hypothetical protein
MTGASSLRGDLTLFFFVHCRKTAGTAALGTSPLGCDFPLPFRIHRGEAAASAFTLRALLISLVA